MDAVHSTVNKFKRTIFVLNLHGNHIGISIFGKLGRALLLLLLSIEI